MTSSEITSVLRDVAIVIPSLIGTCTAVLDLRTWKLERGPVVRDLPRRLLANTYRFRGQIQHIRSPLMQHAEMEHPPTEIDTEEGRHFYAIYSAYRKRMEPASETRHQILVDLIEAEELWGPDIRAKYDTLWRVSNKLIIAIYAYFAELNPEKPLIHISMDEEGDRASLMYRGSAEEDEFGQELDNAIRDIEKSIRPHLRRRTRKH